MASHKFVGQPARYKTSFHKSIYFIFPTDYIGISPTVNLYGAQFGTDKIAHIFQQGYSYYKIYNHALAKGLTTEQAVKKAVKWGQNTERTYYGTLISGVYSIGSNIKPAVLILKNGVWTFNEDADLQEILLKPFISDHFNEALNPSIFIKGLRSFVRRSVRKQSCKKWFNQYPNLSQVELEKTSKAMTLWFREDYGFTDNENFITIANTCFNNKVSAVEKSD
jgi:hypothetical protein